VRHGSLYARLVANTAEPENAQACWTWTGPTRRHGGGDRPAVSLRTPGAGREGKPRQHNAARLMLKEFGELAETHEASHLCRGNWLCINPDHLIGESKQDNIHRREGWLIALPESVEADDGVVWDVVGVVSAECPF